VSGLRVQAASIGLVYGYAADGQQFDLRAPSKVMGVPGVHSAHLVTAGRPPEDWCLVMEPCVAVIPKHATQLERLMKRVARQLGMEGVQFLLPVERQDGGRPADASNWLKW